jgi:hypothetical protein
MTREKERSEPPAQGAVEDPRERFVLRGGTDGVAPSVPPTPSSTVDIEEVLRRLEWPERRRAHRRSEL